MVVGCASEGQQKAFDGAVILQDMKQRQKNSDGFLGSLSEILDPCMTSTENDYRNSENFKNLCPEPETKAMLLQRGGHCIDVAPIQDHSKAVVTSGLRHPQPLLYHCFHILRETCSFSYPGSQPRPTDPLWACKVCSLEFRCNLGGTVVHLINEHNLCDWIYGHGVQVSKGDTELLRRLFQHSSFNYTFHRWSWSSFRDFYVNASRCRQKELMETANWLAIDILQQFLWNAIILRWHGLDSESITKSDFSFSKSVDRQFEKLGLDPLSWASSPYLDPIVTSTAAEIGQLDGQTSSKPDEENVFGRVNLDVKGLTANEFEQAEIDPTVRLKLEGKKKRRKKNKKTFESEWVRRDKQKQPVNRGKSNENQKIGSAINATSDPPTRTGEPSAARGASISSKRRFEDFEGIVAPVEPLGKPPKVSKRRRERQTTTTNWDGDESANAFTKYRAQHGMYDVREKEKEEGEEIASAVSEEVDRLFQVHLDRVKKLATKNEEERRCAEETLAQKEQEVTETFKEQLLAEEEQKRLDELQEKAMIERIMAAYNADNPPVVDNKDLSG